MFDVGGAEEEEVIGRKIIGDSNNKESGGAGDRIGYTGEGGGVGGGCGGRKVAEEVRDAPLLCRVQLGDRIRSVGDADGGGGGGGKRLWEVDGVDLEGEHG